MRGWRGSETSVVQGSGGTTQQTGREDDCAALPKALSGDQSPALLHLGSFLRFASLRHPDTRHITGVLETSSQYAPSESIYVRKSDPSFMRFQQDDVERRRLHNAAVRLC